MKLSISCCVLALMAATISSFPYRLPQVVYSPLTLQQTMLYKAMDRDLPRVIPLQQYAMLQNMMMGNTPYSGASGAPVAATKATSSIKNTAIVAGGANTGLNMNTIQNARTMYGGARGFNTPMNMNTLQQARIMYGGDLPDMYDVYMPYYGY